MKRRAARKPDAPSTLSVPCVRAVISEEHVSAVPSAVPAAAAAKPRKRKPRFVF
jgi:hypothetical protein